MLIFSYDVMARVKLNYMKGYGFREPFSVYTGVKFGTRETHGGRCRTN